MSKPVAELMLPPSGFGGSDGAKEAGIVGDDDGPGVAVGLGLGVPMAGAVSDVKATDQSAPPVALRPGASLFFIQMFTTVAETRLDFPPAVHVAPSAPQTFGKVKPASTDPSAP